MFELSGQIADAVSVIRQRWRGAPRVGMILGTGLGQLAEQIDQEAVMPYESIPHFPRSTALGHTGQLVCGQLAGVSVVAMEGRFHAYEGYSLAQITLPVRVMKALGIELLIVSCASGGMNPNFKTGDILVIDDHINLMGDNPLIGINDDSLGPRFPDMSQPYDPVLVERALEIAAEAEIVAHRGVYVGVKGPNYETRAEYRFFRLIGADAVGMSTVPEVLVAAHCGLRVLALSTITNICIPDSLQPVSGEQVVAAASRSAQKVRRIVLGILQDLAAKVPKSLV